MYRPPRGCATPATAFTVSAQDTLTDANGNPVLGQGGGQIKVTDGKVSSTALGVFEVPSATKQGENLYTGASTGKAAGSVRQGALEDSGVDAAKVMVEMITSLRDFQWTAGHPGDRPDAPDGLHRGRLGQSSRLARLKSVTARPMTPVTKVNSHRLDRHADRAQRRPRT